MPIGYAVDRERRLVFVRAWGVLTDTSLRLQAEALAGDPKFDPAFSILVDATDVEVHKVTLGFLQSFPTSFSRRARRAIVVGDLHGLALAEAYSGWASAEGAALVTRDLGEALEWLGLAPETPLPGQLDASFHEAERGSSMPRP